VTHLRNERPQKFSLDNGELISGFEIGLRTMKKGEQAYFLMDPKFAFGPQGCAPRIPQDAWLLFRIQLVSFNECTEGSDEGDQQETFELILKKASDLRAMGNNMKLILKDVNGAIRSYMRGWKMLWHVSTVDDEEDKQRLEALLKIGRNLMVCFNEKGHYKRVCTVYNNLINTAPRITSMDVKVLYLRGKAQFVLGDYNEAGRSLRKAIKLEPTNETVRDELLKLEKCRMEDKDKQRVLAQRYFGNVATNQQQRITQEDTLSELHDIWMVHLQKFKDSKDSSFPLPVSLDEEEYKACMSACDELSLLMGSKVMDGKKVFVVKRIVNN